MFNHNAKSYTTDDRDARELTKLYCEVGGNGDYYIGSRKVGERNLVNAVRICTSGGAAFINTDLMLAVAAVYRALEVNEQP